MRYSMSKKAIYINGKQQAQGLNKKVKLSEVGLHANSVVSEKKKEKEKKNG